MYRAPTRKNLDAALVVSAGRRARRKPLALPDSVAVDDELDRRLR